MSEREHRGNRVGGHRVDESLAKAARANHLRTWCGCHPEVLVARNDGFDAAAPEAA